VLGFLTGLYPVGFEGRIHYSAASGGGGAAGGALRSSANSHGGSDGSPAGRAAPVIAPAGALPAASFGHAMSAWVEAREEEEHEGLRHDLAEHVWVQRSTLLAPYL